MAGGFTSFLMPRESFGQRTKLVKAYDDCSGVAGRRYLMFSMSPLACRRIHVDRAACCRTSGHHTHGECCSIAALRSVISTQESLWFGVDVGCCALQLKAGVVDETRLPRIAPTKPHVMVCRQNHS